MSQSARVVAMLADGIINDDPRLARPQGGLSVRSSCGGRSHLSALAQEEESQLFSPAMSDCSSSYDSSSFDYAAEPPPRVWKGGDACKRGDEPSPVGPYAWRLPARSNRKWDASRPATAPEGHRPRAPPGITCSTPFLSYRDSLSARYPLHMNAAGIPQPSHWARTANPVNSIDEGRVRLGGRLTDAAFHGELRGASVAPPPQWRRRAHTPQRVRPRTGVGAQRQAWFGSVPSSSQMELRGGPPGALRQASLLRRLEGAGGGAAGASVSFGASTMLEGDSFDARDLQR
jgi:hypothetical protein